MYFIIVPSMGLILLILLGFFILGSAVFGIYFGLTHSTSEDDGKGPWKDKVYSKSQITGLAINEVALLMFVVCVITGFVTHSSTCGVIGILGWIVTSLIAAYSTSPLRLLLLPTEWDSGNGCAYFLYLPILVVASVASLCLIMFVSWIFALIAVVKNMSKKALVLVVLCILLGIAAVFAFIGISSYSEQEVVDEKIESQNRVLQRIESAIQAQEVKKIDFTEEELSSFKEINISNPFKHIDARQLVAEHFCTLNKDGDIEKMFDFIDFLELNYAGGMVSSTEDVNICFSDEFIENMAKTVADNGVYYTSNDICNVYFYLDREIWIEKTNAHISIKNKKYDTYGQLGTYRYMINENRKYSDQGKSYFMVGDNVEYYEESPVVTGNCSRCSGTGKVTKHFGNSWNDKPGYKYGKTCGACGGTGYAD